VNCVRDNIPWVPRLLLSGVCFFVILRVQFLARPVWSFSLLQHYRGRRFLIAPVITEEHRLLKMSTLPVETNAGVVTSWLAVPTGFSAPPACSSAIYSQQGSAGQLIAFDPFYQSIVPSFTTACFPDQVTLWYNQGTDPSSVTSLGPFQCPGGYTTGFTSEDSSSTQIACCPSYVFPISLFSFI
jgi:hypothetical protein